MTDISKAASWIFGPTGMLVLEGIKQANKLVDTAAEKGMDDLLAELAKQEARLQFELKQAKIAQELAIAQRISEAETVEIEEFYDLSGKVKAGVSLEEKSANVGILGEGTRVTKRIYTFKGRVAVTDK
ncbi:hypothetical protein MSKU15_1019 [Komagataeibacter diospyri]|uniref:hypothetical protein n=1 Tax=Komagataeibacter diospyri TaxID=1932662 RepID=UPI00113DF5EA|nr:hypothetical protein [Komagataeibacter diospyri]GCE89418.1 hypothetical protein MSKU15_1019 [Komagataeibacter diospyri]